MPGYGLILTLTGGLSAALLFGYMTHRIGLSPIVGYLLAGTGGRPVHAGLRRRRGHGRTAGRGRRHPADVRRRPAVSRRGAAGRAARRVPGRDRAERGRDGARARCWPGPSDGTGRGAASCSAWRSSVASTVVLVRVLVRPQPTCTRRPATSPSGGWSSRTCSRWWRSCCCRRSSAEPPTARTCGWRSACTALKVAALVAFTALVGTRVIPQLLDHVARTRSRELFTLAVLVIALGIAVGSALVFGVSMALGAFLAGHGRRSVRVQPAGRLGCAADARRVRRAVLRLGGDAARPRALLENPGLLAGRARRSCWSAKPLVGVRARVGDALSAGAWRCRWRSRWRRSASSRSSCRTSAASWAS